MSDQLTNSWRSATGKQGIDHKVTCNKREEPMGTGPVSRGAEGSGTSAPYVYAYSRIRSESIPSFECRRLAKGIVIRRLPLRI